MLYVIATVNLFSGRRDDFLARFRQVMPLVHDEQGCIEYGPAIDVATDIPAQGGARPDVVTIVERWESLDDLKAHLVAPHMIAYRADVKEMVERTTLQILEPAG